MEKPPVNRVSSIYRHDITLPHCCTVQTPYRNLTLGTAQTFPVCESSIRAANRQHVKPVTDTLKYRLC
ncbi:hypothetical protein GCM10009570_22490 [Dietzia natronolimnaea]